MKFHMTPGSCSTGIHILLETLELPFEVYSVNLMAGDQLKPEYLAINPKATIPTLVRDDGTSITEFQAIAWWLARRYPKAQLLPPNCQVHYQRMQQRPVVRQVLWREGIGINTPPPFQGVLVLGISVEYTN